MIHDNSPTGYFTYGNHDLGGTETTYTITTSTNADTGGTAYVNTDGTEYVTFISDGTHWIQENVPRGRTGREHYQDQFRNRQQYWNDDPYPRMDQGQRARQETRDRLRRLQELAAQAPPIRFFDDPVEPEPVKRISSMRELL